jgi:hypothetical protein
MANHPSGRRRDVSRSDVASLSKQQSSWLRRLAPDLLFFYIQNRLIVALLANKMTGSCEEMPNAQFV